MRISGLTAQIMEFMKIGNARKIVALSTCAIKSYCSQIVAQFGSDKLTWDLQKLCEHHVVHVPYDACKVFILRCQWLGCMRACWNLVWHSTNTETWVCALASASTHTPTHTHAHTHTHTHTHTHARTPWHALPQCLFTDKTKKKNSISCWSLSIYFPSHASSEKSSSQSVNCSN